jgi:signal transduction histidine kinase
LPRPWRWRRGGTDFATGAPRPSGHDEDARLLRNTRLRLMAVSGLVTLLILLVLGGAVYATASNEFTNGSVDRLRDYATVNEAWWSGYVSGTGFSRLPQDRDIQVGNRFAGLYVIGVQPDGTVLFATRFMPPGTMPVQAGLNAVTSGGSDVRDMTTSSGAPVRVFSESVTLPDGTKYLIQTLADRTEEASLLGLLQTVLLGGGLLALLAALLAGYLYAGRALVPIRASIDRREGALQRQREFAANASHELRTPLTVIGASVEDLKRNRRSKVQDVGEAIGDIEAEVRHMTALVEDMLLLARTDSGVVQVERVPLDLGDIAADAASSLTMLGQERGVNVVLDPLPAPVVGDPLRLRQLVTILVDNAIRHSPAGSTVEARVRPAAGAALLQVDDRGPGIKPEDLPRLFERFWRADNAPAGGTGLGLAIAKWIVEQHGGQIGAVNRPDGGASFNVWLPSPGGRELAWNPEMAAADAAADAAVDATPEPSVPPEAWAAPEQPS